MTTLTPVMKGGFQGGDAPLQPNDARGHWRGPKLRKLRGESRERN
jgi:hypothetical protein